MSNKYQAMFSPIKIGSIEVKNRVMIAPMEGTNIIDWLTSCRYRPEVHDYYIERCKDGVGLIVPGMTPVRSMIGDRWLHENPEVFEQAAPLLDEIHSYGTKVFLQIGLFCGRNSVIPTQLFKMQDAGMGDVILEKTGINLNTQLVTPDEGAPSVWMPDHFCRALTADEIREYVNAYAQTALLCKQAGFDGVEVHAVHEGYLMDQFTLPYTNHRTDEYGGSFENRYRFATEVVHAIKDLCGADYPVSMRYSVTSKTIDFNEGAVPGEEYVEAGRTMEESERAIKYLEEAGVDMFSCDNGTYDAWFWAHPPVYMPLNCNLEDVEHIAQFTDAPVYCAGRMQPAVAEQALEEGKIDGVGFGRQFLTDEQFLTKLQKGRENEIRPCIGCHSGCLGVATWNGVAVEADPNANANGRMCALNPRTFCEERYGVVPAKNPKHFAVIGGGIGGMEFAIQAAKRGNTVDLYEKSDELGGAFISASVLSFKEKDRELLAWYKRELAASGANVHMNTEVTDLSALDADEIVVATGTKGARHLSIPGAEHAIDAISFLLDQSQAGQKVAVIGGGLTGCEIAYELALQGKEPCIVEMMDDLIAVPGVCYANSSMLRELMRYYQVPVYLNSQTKEIRENSIVVETPEGEVEVPVDTVITSIGYEAGNAFEGQMGDHVHVIGDAKKVGNLKSAIWDANDLVVELSE